MTEENRQFRLGDVVYRSPFDLSEGDLNLADIGKILSAVDPNDYVCAVGEVNENLAIIPLRLPHQPEKQAPFRWPEQDVFGEAGPLFPSWLAVLEDGLRRLEERAKELAVARAAISAASVGLLSQDMAAAEDEEIGKLKAEG